MDDLQIINRNNSILDVIFDPKSDEIYEINVKSYRENTIYWFYHKRKWMCVYYKSQEATRASVLKADKSYIVYNSTQDPYNPLQCYSNTNTND